MKIQIAQKLRPFSHAPGAMCVIPGTCLEIEAFPTRLKIGGQIDLKFQLTGPAAGFTLQQDLEKNCVWVFGKAREGFYRLKIKASDEGVVLTAEKTPASGLSYEGSKKGLLRLKDALLFSLEVKFHLSSSIERLSLGSHKAQDFDKKQGLKEMLPLLFLLGQKIPRIAPQPLLGTAALLEMPKERLKIEESLQAFLLAAFTPIFIPRLNDSHHQGLAPEETAEGNRFFLIQEGAKTVRGLFFQQNERRLKFLPLLPVSLDCGRMLQMKAEGIGELDFEWTKKLLRRVILRASTSGEVLFDLQNELKSFRVRSSLNEKGRRHQKSEPLLLQAGKTYFLDLFQK
jgi:hypothetical protein